MQLNSNYAGCRRWCANSQKRFRTSNDSREV